MHDETSKVSEFRLNSWLQIFRSLTHTQTHRGMWFYNKYRFLPNAFLTTVSPQMQHFPHVCSQAVGSAFVQHNTALNGIMSQLRKLNVEVTCESQRERRQHGRPTHVNVKYGVLFAACWVSAAYLHWWFIWQKYFALISKRTWVSLSTLVNTLHKKKHMDQCFKLVWPVQFKLMI